jgi:hypothetical protein
MTRVIPPLLEDSSSAKALERIAAALERLAGAHPLPCDFSAAEAFVFAAGAATLVQPTTLASYKIPSRILGDA